MRIVRLEGMMTPELKAGYIDDTLLDPHAANNNLPGQQMSIGGGILAPTGKDGHQQLPGTGRGPSGIHSLGGRRGPGFLRAHRSHRQSKCIISGGKCRSRATGPLVHYYNLTPSKVTHSGKTGIQFWYRNFIVPSLGDQAPLVQELQLNGQIDHGQMILAATCISISNHRARRMSRFRVQSDSRSFPARPHRARL